MIQLRDLVRLVFGATLTNCKYQLRKWKKRYKTWISFLFLKPPKPGSATLVFRFPVVAQTENILATLVRPISKSLHTKWRFC